MDLKTKISKEFGGKIRVRVCGLLVHNHKILLVKHNGIGESGVLWSPPGGAVHFGENLNSTLMREFYEETGLKVKPRNFLTINEYISTPFHAIELFYYVSCQNLTDLKIGTDPELNNTQSISDVRFLDINTILSIPKTERHQLIQTPLNIQQLIDGHNDV